GIRHVSCNRAREYSRAGPRRAGPYGHEAVRALAARHRGPGRPPGDRFQQPGCPCTLSPGRADRHESRPIRKGGPPPRHPQEPAPALSAQPGSRLSLDDDPEQGIRQSHAGRGDQGMGLRRGADGSRLPRPGPRQLRLFAELPLADFSQDVARNIVSLGRSQDLFDDLADDPAEWLLAQAVEAEVKPPSYRSGTP